MTTIKVDTNYINAKMDELISIASEEIILENVECSSTTLVPSECNSIVKKMIQFSKITFDKILVDALNIKSVGDNYSNLDIDLSNLASELDMNVESSMLPHIDLELYEYEPVSYNDLNNKINEISNKYENNGQSATNENNELTISDSVDPNDYNNIEEPSEPIDPSSTGGE